MPGMYKEVQKSEHRTIVQEKKNNETPSFIFFLSLSKIESRKRNGNYQIFEIEISLSALDFSFESETLVNAYIIQC